MARRKWKQLRVRGAAAAAASFTGPLTPVCWAEGRGVALLGGLNIRAATAELNPDLDLLEVSCGAASPGTLCHSSQPGAGLRLAWQVSRREDRYSGRRRVMLL